MGKRDSVRDIVERVVSTSFSTHVSALKDELIEQTCQQLEAVEVGGAPAPADASDTPPGGTPTNVLNAAVSAIVDSPVQADILGALVEGAGRFAERVALFVIRAGAGSGWRAHGLNCNDAIKSLSIDVSGGLAGRAFQDRIPASAPAAEFDANFVANFGAPAEGTNALVLPLVIRDKVSALLYADAGAMPAGKLDPFALECLARCSSLWLEVVGARKAGTPVATETTAPPPEPAPASAVEAPPVPVLVDAATAAAAAPAPAMESAAKPEDVPVADEEVHKKAKRFAKLLVEEIKLYNKSKVEEGRKRKDIYVRLKDDIDKSRNAYDKRYGQSAAAGADYFTQELVRILCDDDVSLLGEDFSR